MPVIKLGLTGYESIYQCIRTIILTEKGSVPFRPRMGIGTGTLLDTNFDRIKLSLEIIDQLNTYEPRIKARQVVFRQGNTIGEVIIGIIYTVKETGEDKSYFFGTE